MKWTKRSSAQAHAAKARRRMQQANEWPELVRVPRGQFLGTLEWHDASGQVRRWVIRQGSRANNISVLALIAGHQGGRLARTWTWVLDRLRRCLCVPRKQRMKDEG